MGKIAELKAKLSEKLALLRGKLGKNDANAPENPYSSPSALQKTRKTWREGGPGTRILLILMLLTVTVGIYSLVQLSLKLLARRAALQALMHKGTEKYDKMEEFLKRQAEMKFDAASITSIDRVRINSKLDNGKSAYLEIGLFVRCDSPRTAKIVEEIYPKLHDAIITKIQLIEESEITSEEGKDRLKTTMLEAMNAAMPQGKILEVFFSNMIFE